MRDSHERFDRELSRGGRSFWQHFREAQENSFLRAEHEARYQLASRLTQGALVLDIAAGSGYGSYALATQGAKRVVGVELDSAAVAAAQSKFIAPNLEYRQGSGDDLSGLGEIFDTIVSFETIEHINQDRRFLEELDCHLAPGGTLIISTPNRHISNPGKSLMDKPENPFHVREYTREEFRALLAEQFEVKESFLQGRYWKENQRMNHFLRLLKTFSLATGIGRGAFVEVREDDEETEPSYSIYRCTKKE